MQNDKESKGGERWQKNGRSTARMARLVAPPQRSTGTWRNQARIIDKCELGEIVSITGLNAKAGLEGRIELFLTAFSKITKKN